MANFEIFDYSQTWLLTKYSKFLNNLENDRNSMNLSYNKLKNDDWKVSKNKIKRNLCEFFCKFLLKIRQQRLVTMVCL
jgi:hypothetical protein